MLQLVQPVVAAALVAGNGLRMPLTTYVRTATPLMAAQSSSGSINRRAANGIGMLTLLNICSLSLKKEPLPIIQQSRWAPEEAADAALAGALCPTVSCADARFAEVNALLDTTGVQTNAHGMASERKPIVYLETAFGLKKTAAPAQYHVVVVSPIPQSASDSVRLMWLRDAESGRIVAARSFEDDEGTIDEEGPPTLVGCLLYTSPSPRDS